jgi:tetratricopeptide (TPR) repeat protein
MIKTSLLTATLVVSVAHAQTSIPLPEQSSRASVSQRIALTDVSISYHRPLVQGRKIWGGVVGFGEVWRAGANENTTITFSDPVLFEGKAVPRGTYGLFMFPTADSWQVVLSKNASSWGSYNYDKAEDLLRVTVKPRAAEMHEALSYDFTDLVSDGATIVLAWEKLAVPFRVQVAKETTLANVRNGMRSGAQFSWVAGAEAANWCLQEKLGLDEALKWIDKSIKNEERFDNLITRADLLDALKKPEAAAARADAMKKATVQQLYFYGRNLQGLKRQPEAFAIFKEVAKRWPDHWLAHMGTAREAVSRKDFALATKELSAAVKIAPAEDKPRVEMLLRQAGNKEDINK